jgi:hypothetical protein
MDKKNGKKMKGGTALHGYERTFNIDTTSRMVIMNTDPLVINYYYELTKLHELIDEKHDQLESGRGNKLKSTDKLFKQRIIDAINKSTVGNISEFTTGIDRGVGIKSFNVNSGIHTLTHALERLGDSFYIQPNTDVPSSVTSPSLPSLQILPWNCDNTIDIKNELKNCMVVYKGFHTNGGCTNQVAGCKVNNQVGITSTGIVHDAGSSDLFGYITSPNCEAKQTGDLLRNIISGKLDSSSSSNKFAVPSSSNNQLAQTLIPFMNIYSGTNTLIGVIMLYAAPILEGLGEQDVKDNYAVFLAFKYIPTPSGNYSQLYSSDREIQTLLTQGRAENIAYLNASKNWFKVVVADQVPNLPEIADFMAGARGCFSKILKYITGVTADLQNKCQPYVDVAKGVWSQLPRNAHVFGTDQDLFVMAFLMKIKHIGDKFRLIDSFMLSETYGQDTATGTIDTFMMRYACLANLYVYCANKGGDMTINDVRLQSPAELAAQMKAAEERAEKEALAKAEEEARVAKIERDKRIQKCEDRKRNIIGTTNFYVELYDYFFESENGEFKINDRRIFEAKQSSMTRIIDTLGIMKEGILNTGSVVLKPLRMTNRIVNALLNATNENYVYRGANFTKKEMSTILTYYLTLSSYFDAFHILCELKEIDKMYANILKLKKMTSDIQSIVCDPDSENSDLSEYEGMINEISDRMNILDKFRLICMFEPKYTGTNHRYLFDDAFRFLKMKNLDMSLAINYLGGDYLKYPELEYTPNIGDVLFIEDMEDVLFPPTQVIGGNRNTQYGGFSSNYLIRKMEKIYEIISLINGQSLDPLVKLDMITYLLNEYNDVLNTLLYFGDFGTRMKISNVQKHQSSISIIQEHIAYYIALSDPLEVEIIPPFFSTLPTQNGMKIPGRIDYQTAFKTLQALNPSAGNLTENEGLYLHYHDDVEQEMIYESNINEVPPSKILRDYNPKDLEYFHPSQYYLDNIRKPKSKKPERTTEYLRELRRSEQPFSGKLSNLGDRDSRGRPITIFNKNSDSPRLPSRSFKKNPSERKRSRSLDLRGPGPGSSYHAMVGGMPKFHKNLRPVSITHKLHAKPKQAKTLKKHKNHRRKTRKHKKH